MTRHIIRISLVMLLGVVTSVAVAWGFAFVRPSVDRELVSNLDVVSWIEPVPEHWPRPFSNRIARVVGFTFTDQLGDDGGRDSSNEFWQSRFCYGYPLRCVKHHESGRWSNSQPLGTRELFERGALSVRIPYEPVGLLTLPYHPIWPGLLANTAIYGGVWYAMLFGPGYFLRWRRRRAGRCAKCGYDLRGLSPAPGSGSDSVCPECGAER